MKRLFLAALISAWAVQAFALNPSLDANQYAHTAWRVRDGFAKGEIQAIAQTADGYLWLGTSFGLFRFDGVRAVRWESLGQPPLPSDNISSLLGARDGSLWIATGRSLSRWNGRTLTPYDQLAGRMIWRLLEDRDGVVWITSGSVDANGLMSPCRVDRGRLECDAPGSPAFGLFEDSRGALWGSTDHGVQRLKPGSRVSYELTPDASSPGAMSEDDDGTLLIARSGGIYRLVGGRSSMKVRFPPSMPSATADSMLRDRDGGLWLGTFAHGLVHVHQGITDVYTEADGLSGDSIRNLFEDREGDVWVATNAGLDRFHDTTGAAVAVRQGLLVPRVDAVAAATDGGVWAAAPSALHRLRNNEITIYRERTDPLALHRVSAGSRLVREVDAEWADHLMAIFQDRRGRMWVAGRRGVGYLDRDRLVPVEGLPGGSTRAIAEDSEALWVINDERGVFRVSPDGSDIVHISQTTFDRPDLIMAAAADATRKGVWLGFIKGGVVFFADGRVQASYGPSQRLGAGTVRQLLFDRDAALWAATEGGVSRVKDGHVATLTRQNGLPCDTILSLVQDEARALWLTSRCGVVRISRDEIDRWIEKGGSVRTTTFDDTDGMRTYVDVFPYTAPIVKSADGRLWFISPDGLGVIDPRRLAVNTRPPPVHIERITADRKEYDAASATGERVRLPPLIRDLQVDYTALSLVASEKNQFRYLLEGYDAGWQEAGTRRQAFYTNLRPRSYRFRVIASNNSGVWNEAGASLDLTIAPAYYQTNWFLALVAGMVLALVWTAHRVRLHIVERHQQEISALNERMMKAQEQERIRIAGELHDGVMQQMLAMTMMLGTAKRKVSGSADAVATIDKIQQKLIQTGTDIRQLSHGLHPPLLQDEGLPAALRSYCEQFSAASGMAVTCTADEPTRELSRGAALALYRVMQEALGNAAKHASAKHISVTLKRANGAVALTVSDDGAGFDRSRLGTSGGLGLVMMRERAAQLNGTFDFETAPGRGTTIRVVIPFR